MAATSFLSLSLQPKPETLRFSPSLSSISRPRRRKTRSLSISNPKRNPISIPRSSNPSSNPSSPSVDKEPAKPQIDLEFVGPKAGADGSYPVDTASAISGEKLLRSIMIENRLELYAAYGKVMNCGGGGSCGTCIVEIIDGKELLNERTDTENRYLKKKPESWRLACQTIVGNKENTGKVVVQRLPQWKK